MTDAEAWESLKRAHRWHNSMLSRDRIRAEMPLFSQAMDRRNRYSPCTVVEEAKPPGHERGQTNPIESDQPNEYSVPR